MSSITKSLLKGGSYTILGLLISALLQYTYNLILGRVFGAELTGVFAFGLSIINIGFVIGQMGVGETLLKFASTYSGIGDYQKLKGLLKTFFPIAILGITLITFFVYFFFQDIIVFSNKSEFEQYLKKFILLIIPLGVVQVSASVFQGQKRLDLMVLIREIGKPTVIVSSLMLSYIFTLSFEVFIDIYIVFAYLLSFSAIILLLRLERKILVHQAKFEFKKWKNYLLSVSIIDLFRAANSWIDILLLGFLLPAHDIGLYFTSIRIALLSTLGLTAINAIFSPIISELWAKKDIKSLSNTFKLTAKWSATIVLPTSLIIILSSGELMGMFGKEFIQGKEILNIIILGRIINGFTGGVSRILVMSNYQKLEMYNTFITIILIVGGIHLIVPLYGVIGAAILNTSVISIMNVIKVIQVKHYLGIQPFEFGHIKIIIACGVAFVLASAIKSLFPVDLAYASMFMKTGVFSFIFISTMFIVGLDKDHKMLLEMLKKRFH